MSNKIEVFRMTPIEGKYYKTTTFTEIKNNKYWSTNELVYVGKYLRHASYGFRDSAEHYAIFDKNGSEIIVHYTYEGTTCFVEVEREYKEIILEIKKELLKTINNKQVLSLEDLCKQQLTTEELKISRELGV